MGLTPRSFKNDVVNFYYFCRSGWKKDWVGNWIKDENAEFDSDEEPPDLP